MKRMKNLEELIIIFLKLEELRYKINQLMNWNWKKVKMIMMSLKFKKMVLKLKKLLYLIEQNKKSFRIEQLREILKEQLKMIEINSFYSKEE